MRDITSLIHYFLILFYFSNSKLGILPSHIICQDRQVAIMRNNTTQINIKDKIVVTPDLSRIITYKFLRYIIRITVIHKPFLKLSHILIPQFRVQHFFSHNLLEFPNFITRRQIH